MAKPEFRTRLSENLLFLIKAVTPLKNSGKDWNYSDIATAAFIDFLNKPENQALLKNHDLGAGLVERGLDWPEGLNNPDEESDQSST